MTSERLFNSFIPPSPKKNYTPKHISGYAPDFEQFSIIFKWHLLHGSHYPPTLLLIAGVGLLYCTSSRITQLRRPAIVTEGGRSFVVCLYCRKSAWIRRRQVCNLSPGLIFVRPTSDERPQTGQPAIAAGMCTIFHSFSATCIKERSQVR